MRWVLVLLCACAKVPPCEDNGFKIPAGYDKCRFGDAGWIRSRAAPEEIAEARAAAGR